MAPLFCRLCAGITRILLKVAIYLYFKMLLLPKYSTTFIRQTAVYKNDLKSVQMLEDK